MRCKTLCPLYPEKRTCAAQLGMSAMGQEQTYAPQKGMSALPPKATAKADMVCVTPAVPQKELMQPRAPPTWTLIERVRRRVTPGEFFLRFVVIALQACARRATVCARSP